LRKEGERPLGKELVTKEENAALLRRENLEGVGWGALLPPEGESLIFLSILRTRKERFRAHSDKGRGRKSHKLQAESKRHSYS